jgi:hypothetical protein
MGTRASSPPLSLAVDRNTAGGSHAWRTLWITVAVIASLGAASHNPILTPASMLLWPLLIYLTWRSGEPPALMFVVAMHWLQAAAAIFYTDFFSASLADAFGGIELESATWLSLCGVLALAVGMRLGLLRAAPSRGEEIAAEGARIDIGKAFTAYGIAFVLSFGCAIAAARIPGISQPLIMLGAVKWVFVFIVGYAVLEQRRGYLLLGLVVTLELGVGFLGFFASFKSVFFVLFVALVTSPLALRGRRLLLLTSTALLLLLLGTVWTAVKSDYREFLNQGFRSQEVLVPVEERVGKLGDLLDGFNAQQLGEGFQTMILRISYVQFFALTIKNVPANLPYENGALWADAIKHVLTPRLFFPDKAAIDDSARTSLYTGMDVAGAEQGTSIGIGYFAESYVDFGPTGMFIPIALVGAGLGCMYRMLVIKARYKLIGGAIVTSITVFGASTIETSNMKVIGGVLTMFLVMGSLYWLFAHSLMNWLTGRTSSDK